MNLGDIHKELKALSQEIKKKHPVKEQLLLITKQIESKSKNGEILEIDYEFLMEPVFNVIEMQDMKLYPPLLALLQKLPSLKPFQNDSGSTLLS